MGDSLDIDLLPASVRDPKPSSIPSPDLPLGGRSFKEAVASYERQLIVHALKSTGGVQKRAAETLKVKPTTLHEMMKRLKVTTDDI
ncbi:MAG: helix-turn-helix domain-containing protein [Acidobacteriota bacterium]